MAKPRKNEGAPIGYEAQLWQMADALRGSMDAVASGSVRRRSRSIGGSYPKEFEHAPGDILLVMTCQTAGGEILGTPARVPDDGRLHSHNQRLGKVVVRENAPVDRDFLYWLFLSRQPRAGDVSEWNEDPPHRALSD
jgi:hypothetical protein